MVDFRLAVKAFIVNKNRLFILKREKRDVQKPNIWEIPGGRLELGEDPILGLMREIREETGLYVRPLCPLSIRHFQRDDKQLITMIVFYCRSINGFLKLSGEHSDYEWIKLKSCKKKLTPFFHKEVDIFHKLKLHKK
jgi:8-oxo-dGTP pyrophosphatase MutT (NUDIX family)